MRHALHSRLLFTLLLCLLFTAVFSHAAAAPPYFLGCNLVSGGFVVTPLESFHFNVQPPNPAGSTGGAGGGKVVPEPLTLRFPVGVAQANLVNLTSSATFSSCIVQQSGTASGSNPVLRVTFKLLTTTAVALQTPATGEDAPPAPAGGLWVDLSLNYDAVLVEYVTNTP